MNALNYHALAVTIGALLFVPLSPAAARADDDDDWEDRWEEYEDDWEDAREEAEERWERRHWHRQYPHGAYRVDPYPAPRYHAYYREPAARYYYPDGRRVYRYYDGYPRHYYGGRVHAGPATVYYGRRGAVHVGPLHVYW
jgi:hypothetical protein